MRAFLIVTTFIAAMLILGAALNYPAYGLLGPWFPGEPHRVTNLVAKLLAVPGFFLLMAGFGLYSRRALGFGLPRRAFLMEIARGWGMGLVMMVPLAVTLFLLGIRVPKPTLPAELLGPLALSLVGGVLAGLLVGLIEETFFRGGIYGAIRREASWWQAVLLSSLIFAAMHFIDSRPLPAGAILGWGSGLEMLAQGVAGAYHWGILDSFIALFAVGALLALIREQTGNIGYCIGLHAGWVAVIKLLRDFTWPDPSHPLAGWVGSYDGVTGWLATLWLALWAVIFYRALAVRA